MKKSLIFIFMLLLCCPSFAQEEGNAQFELQRKNAIKVNILPPILSATGELSYERLIKPNLSAVVGFGGNFSEQRSEFKLNSDTNLEFLDREIQNFYFLGELRRYIDFCGGNCRAAPHGFYAGGFIRYNDLSYSANPQFQNGNTNLDFEMEVNLQSFNFGALLGYQLNLNNWLIDFEFGGLGYAPNWISVNSNTTLTNDALSNLSGALSRNFGIGGNYRAIELDNSSAEFSFWYWTIRYAVSVGYNF